MSATPDHLVAINNLSFSHQDHLIFDDVTITVPRGKIIAIMGPSGSGKTTLLRLIGGLLRPDAGTIEVNDQDVHRLKRHQLDILRRKMGLLFQSGALFSHLTVFENVAFPLREHTDLNPVLLHDLVLMKLEAVGLRGTSDMMPAELSGGMSRRVALARAMALDPELMMYDEPFTGQDPISMGVLIRLIKHLNELLNLTTIIVSHDVEETCSIADYVYLIAHGKVIGEGEPQVLRASTEPQISQFMHGEADGAVPFHYPAKPYIEELLDD
ncbi:MAG: ABC transporter ATP-binding protein [Gammaproteobacteria bacterium]|nr:ABC transporter ATP-binding protein [Gammaproteobacteria bacterium]